MAVLVKQRKKNAVQSILLRGIILCLVPPLKSTVKQLSRIPFPRSKAYRILL